MGDLSSDLEVDLRTLQRTVTFYQTYRRPPRIKGLGWTHYRVLMQLRDSEERAFYQELATTDGLSAQKLSIAIHGERYLSARDEPEGASPASTPHPAIPRKAPGVAASSASNSQPHAPSS